MKTERIAFFNGLECFSENKRQARELPSEFMIIRFGINKYTKDGHQDEFNFTQNDADAVITEFESRGRDLVIDYEHQTLRGSQAPAAGWIKRLFKKDDGLYGELKYWTEQAAEYLKKGEYRYFSPVIQFSRRGKTVTAIHSVALTNHPAMHFNPALAADDSLEVDPSCPPSNINETEFQMKRIFELLGLQEFSDKTSPEALSKAADKVAELCRLAEEGGNFLNKHACKSFDDLEAKISSLPSEETLKALELEITKRDAESAVAVGFSDGKLQESLREWARGFAEKDLAGFKSWLEKAPVIVPLNSNIEQRNPLDDTEAKLSETELKIMRLLGLSDEKIKEINSK